MFCPWLDRNQNENIRSRFSNIGGGFVLCDGEKHFGIQAPNVAGGYDYCGRPVYWNSESTVSVIHRSFIV